jgi:hypothetical protein
VADSNKVAEATWFSVGLLAFGCSSGDNLAISNSLNPLLTSDVSAIVVLTDLVNGVDTPTKSWGPNGPIFSRLSV